MIILSFNFTNPHFSDMNCTFVEAPAVKPAELQMDPKLIEEYNKELDDANKTLLPDDDEDYWNISSLCTVR